MNKFVICAMDKRKTQEELWDNYKTAATAASEAYAADIASSAASYYAYCVAFYAAAYTAVAAVDDLEYYLNKYFDLTGEDREAYQKEADK